MSPEAIERRGGTNLDLAVGPLAVRLADEVGHVAEEDDKRAEDDDLLVEDKELVGDGGGRGRGREGDDARLGHERVAGEGVDEGRRLLGRGRGRRRLEANPAGVCTRAASRGRWEQGRGGGGTRSALSRLARPRWVGQGRGKAYWARARGWTAWRATRAAVERSMVGGGLRSEGHSARASEVGACSREPLEPLAPRPPAHALRLLVRSLPVESLPLCDPGQVPRRLEASAPPARLLTLQPVSPLFSQWLCLLQWFDGCRRAVPLRLYWKPLRASLAVYCVSACTPPWRTSLWLTLRLRSLLSYRPY